jgi:hypothetical protein
MPQEQAQQWTDLWNVVEQKVRPERTRRKANGEFVLRSPLPQKWWIYADKRPALYNAIYGLDRVLVISRVSDRAAFCYLPAGMVYSEQLIVFSVEGRAFFASLQSRPHELWARFFASSMKDDLRYTPSDCFETFPFPAGWETDTSLETIGREYYEYRAQLMRESNKGLTKTYNRFHDPKEKSPEIRRLRDLHAAMDRAVLAAYEWSGIDTTCGFDLDWCEDEAADDASPETIERLETGRYFFETAEEARAFASELVGLG